MRAVVLVGGRGTRLQPLTDDLPKPLLSVGLVSIVERIIARLRVVGVDDVVLALGYRPDAFRDFFPDSRCDDVRLHYVVEPEPLNTGGAIRFAIDQTADLCTNDESVIVLNGDVLGSGSLAPLLARHRAASAPASVGLTRVDDPSRFGVVPTDRTGRASAFIEKPAPGTAPTRLANAGVYILEPRAIEALPQGANSIERDVFPKLVERGELFAWELPGRWIDVGTPDSFLEANRAVIRGNLPRPSDAVEARPRLWCRTPSPSLPDSVTQSLIDRNVQISPGARVLGSVIGTGVTIGAGAVVTNSVLLDRSVVEEGATVDECIVGRDATVATATVVHHEVLARPVQGSPDTLAIQGFHAA